MTKVVYIVAAVGLAVSLIAPGPSAQAAPTTRYFPSTGFSVSGQFLDFFQSWDGMRLFGNPITEETQEDGKTVQYFERARFELHGVPVSTEGEVRLGLLGTALTEGREFLPVKPFSSEADKCYIRETGHSLAGPFHEFWFSEGGVEIFGFPISEQLEEEGNLVQYFERARMEYHPDRPAGQRITLGLLGMEYLTKQGRAVSSVVDEQRWRPIQRGAATYYGAKFHGRRTSSGEPFDMYALTAASRTLPFGTVVKVTNLASGKSVLVTINDRGPWTGGRIIDLSQEAFSRIAPVSSGTVWVEVAILEE